MSKSPHPQAHQEAGVDTRTSTIVVAASNSLDPTLAPAAYRCTGVNDEVEINLALTAAAAVNGSVILLEGDYNTVLTLSVAANVALKGVGWGAVINFNAGGNAVTIAGDNVKLRDFKVVIVAGAGAGGTRPNAVYATGRTNVEITKLWLVGDETEADDGSDLRQCGIFFGINMAYSKTAFCTIENFERHGISFVGTSGNEVEYVMVTGNLCDSNLDNGIRLERSDNCTVNGNTCQGNTEHGIYLLTSVANTLTGNTCQGNSLSGIYMQADDNNLTGNTVRANGNHGIYLYSTSRCVVSGNQCWENTEHGIFLSSAGVNVVSGNVCQRNIKHGIFLTSTGSCMISGNICVLNDSGNTNTYDGISLASSSTNSIVGNHCQINDRWGIYLTSSDDNKIANNYTKSNGAGSIRIQEAASENNTIEFNTVEEGAPSNAGTETRSYGNYDPSTNTFVGDVGVAPF